MVTINRKIYCNNVFSRSQPKNKFQKRKFSNSRLGVFLFLLSLSLNLIFIFLKPKGINLNNFISFFNQIQKKLPLLYFMLTWLSLFIYFYLLGLEMDLLKITTFLLYVNYLKNIYLQEFLLKKEKKFLVEILDVSVFWLITDIFLLIFLYILMQKIAVVYIFFFRLLRKTTYLICVGKPDESSLPYNLALLFFILTHMVEFSGEFVELKSKDVKKFNEGNFFFIRNFFYNFSLQHKLISSFLFFLVSQVFIIIFF